jgi:DNA-binding response OmpR family regulator
VLIVDNDFGVLEAFARTLKTDGHDSVMALDAEGALLEMDTSAPDAVVFALHVSLLDSLMFLRRLRGRQLERQTQVAIVTADYFVDETTRTALRELGADVYFKPVWVQDLVDITRRLLARTS